VSVLSVTKELEWGRDAVSKTSGADEAAKCLFGRGARVGELVKDGKLTIDPQLLIQELVPLAVSRGCPEDRALKSLRAGWAKGTGSNPAPGSLPPLAKVQASAADAEPDEPGVQKAAVVDDTDKVIRQWRSALSNPGVQQQLREIIAEVLESFEPRR
jgi:hypothetical protein